MGAFKDLNRSDIFLTEHVANKSWDVRGTEFGELGISKFVAVTGSSYSGEAKPIYMSDTVVSGSYTSGSYYPQLAYQGLDIEYYRATQSDGSFSGSYDVSLQSTITLPGSRVASGSMLVYSIPRSCFGTSIQMQSIKVTARGGEEFVDNEGVMIYDGRIVGDVIYNRGLIIFTDSSAIAVLNASSQDGDRLQFTSNKYINTYSVDCKVRDKDLNYTYNPTAKHLYNSGSLEFTPYITSVGLYNSFNELLAVAKFSRPIQKAANVDTTIKVQLDIS